MRFGARAVVKLGALDHNLERLRQVAGGARVIAVIKANAYGHGLVTVARHLRSADNFAVARLSEAMRLRKAGVDKPLMLLEGVFTRRETEVALAERFEAIVHDELQLELLEAAPAAAATVWLKVDTGMHRLGFDPDAVAGAMKRLARCRSVGEIRLLTHLANADDLDDPMTGRQLRRFAALLENFDGDISIANSAGLLGWPDSVTVGSDTGQNWVRSGLALFGASPIRGKLAGDFGLRPVMEFVARLISVKRIRKGEPVGYGGTWRAPRDTVLGIFAAGYGDGYPRSLPAGTPVLVNGREVPLAGVVSMDMAAVDLGPGAGDAVGDPVTLWGDGLPVERVAEAGGTIPYTLLCGVMHREVRETRD